MSLSFELSEADLTLQEKIGSGQTSQVHRGTCRGREVAVKTLIMSQVKTENFTREVGIMSQIEHPNIVKLHGVVVTSMPFRVVMEYCAGGTCFELLHNRLETSLTTPQMLRMCKHTAVAMEYLHRFNPQVIHRDLKSLNLLLARPVKSPSDTPLVKVSDFGLARMLVMSEIGSLTCGVGTSYWMAPEVFAGGAYNDKVDVYSYGMVLYEIFCRRIPFEEVEPHQVKGLVMDGKMPDLNMLPIECPEQLHGLIRRCLQTESGIRPSFSEIVQTVSGLEDLRVVVSM